MSIIKHITLKKLLLMTFGTTYVYTILRITSLTTQPYLLLIRTYYRIYPKFSITHIPQYNYSPVFLHMYYKTLPNIFVVPPQYTIRIYMGTPLKIYTTPNSIRRHTWNWKRTRYSSRLDIIRTIERYKSFYY